MNWDYTGAKSYVDVLPPAPVFVSISHETPPYWPNPQADARLKPGILRQHCSSDQLRSNVQQLGPSQVRGPSHLQTNTVVPSQRIPLLRTASLPPVDPSKQLASTPELRQRTDSPSSSQNTPAVTQAAFSPLKPAPILNQGPGGASNKSNMTDPRRNQGQHGQQHQQGHQGQQGQYRPLMGPPETPSRVMQASPNMFSTLQFSPDLFSTQSMGPLTAPAYPQQRLFWDQPGAHLENLPMDQFQTPYQDNFEASFHSSSTVVPNYSPAMSQGSTFDLPQQSPAGPFLDPAGFPMAFQTSPRPPPPSVENPTQFLSSPARRFGGTDLPVTSSFNRPAREIPAYHHQIEESRREREQERKRNKSAAKRADADLIMSSVRRALSPSKTSRPGLKRSQTDSGVSPGQQLRRKSSRVNINDTASSSSKASGESVPHGRSSPLKSIRQWSSSSMARSRSQKSRTALSLAIDEHGLAKTVLQQLPESEDDFDVEEETRSVLSSTDEEDFNIVPSQNVSFAFDNDEDEPAPRYVQPSSVAGRHNEGRRSVTGPLLGKLSRRGTTNSDASNPAPSGKGDAQKALRAIIEDRGRSVSAQGGYASSRQSDSSVQFHSSPPIHQNQFGDFGPSPTTLTDPDLATPSTDPESWASLGATRCICKSISTDGSAMIQCDSCSKWLHAHCVGVDKRRISDVYICVYCESTPVRHPTNRGSVRSSTRGSGISASPLAHKSARSNRKR